MKKTDVFKKTILWIVILLFGIGLLSIGGYYGYRYWCINQIQNYYISLTRASKFDDFSKMQGDFEIVVNLYRQHQSDIMNTEIQCLLIDVNDGVSSAGVYERILEGGTSENRVNKRKKPPEMATSRKEAKYVKNMALFTRI